MGRKRWIAVVGLGVIVLLAIGGAYAYDSSQKDQIADGITVAGVDVGGMNEAEAIAAVQKQLLVPLRRSLKVTFDGDNWTLSGKKLKLHANVEAAVAKAIDESQSGGFPGRLVRYVSGSEVDKGIPADVTYSKPAINRFVRHVAEEVNREPQNADVEPTPSSLEVVAGHDGRKLRDNLLTKELEAAVVHAGGKHAVVARVHSVPPEITKSEVAAEYPSYLTLDRGTFTLRLWKHLKLAKSYTVAVGMEGLETPEGLYQIEAKEENPVWHVPDSAWAGDLAGQTIPPGPDDPIKARWMAIFEGAGIHGTEETESLGTAGSHGCIRMSIPDVIELYPQVEVGTPVYIGD
jgi:lipoprotein-anchoring transpeptidase ErfK/SrfK